MTFIDRYASPDLDARVLERRHRDRGRATARTSATPRSRSGASGVTHLGVQRATVGRDADFRTLAIGFGADLARAEAETILAEPGGFSEMLGVFFADGDQHFDHRSVQDHVAPNCTSDLLYKGALRDREPRRLQRLGPRAPGRAEDERDADLAATSSCPSTRRPTRSRTWRSRRTTSGAATRPAWARSTRRRSSTSQSRGIPRDGGRAADRHRVLPGGAGPRADRRGPRGRRGGDRERAGGRRARMTLVKVCTVADVPEGEARRFAVDGRPVAVVNLGDEGFRASTRSARTRTTSWTRARSTSTTRRSSARSTAPRST